MIKKIIFLILFLALFSASAYSAQNGFEVMSFRPVTDNGRYLSVWDSHVLDSGDWFFGTTLDYSYRPLQITKNGLRETGVLDRVFEQHLYSSVGVIKDRLELGVDIPIGWWLDYRDQNKASFGDILLNAKVSLLDINESSVGLSLIPFITLPTGKSDYFFGSGVVTAGVNLITEFNPAEKVFIAMNLGLLGKKNYTFRDINDSSKLIGGLGLAVVATNNLNVSADLVFKSRLSSLFQKKSETPVELLTGVKYAIAGTGFVVNGAIGGGLINGAGAPQYRIIFGLGYSLPTCKGSAVSTKQEIPEAGSSNLVHFAFNSITMEKNTETIQLDNLADALKKDTTKSLLIEGHADNVGGEAVNDRISKQRVDTVVRYISKHSIVRSRMTIKAYGSRSPVADNNTKQGRQANRRVKVSLQTELR